jgi:hypothetical protein
MAMQDREATASTSSIGSDVSMCGKELADQLIEGMRPIDGSVMDLAPRRMSSGILRNAPPREGNAYVHNGNDRYA